MHNRIFHLQVDEYDETNILSIGEIEEYRPSVNADYYGDDTDYEEDALWFAETFPYINIKKDPKNNKYYFIPTQELIHKRIQALQPLLTTLKEIINKLSLAIPLESNPFKITHELYRIKNIVAPYDSMLFYIQGEDYVDELHFICFLETYKNKKLYIAKSFDMHL